MSAQELIEQVLQLSSAESAEVATEVLLSLHPDDSLDADEQAWIREIESRRAEVLGGTTAMRNWSDVRAEVGAELREP